MACMQVSYSSQGGRPVIDESRQWHDTRVPQVKYLYRREEIHI